MAESELMKSEFNLMKVGILQKCAFCKIDTDQVYYSERKHKFFSLCEGCARNSGHILRGT